MSTYHDLQQAHEREQHQRELRALRDEIDMLRREKAVLVSGLRQITKCFPSEVIEIAENTLKRAGVTSED